jgi:hypothetical protein
VHEKIDLIISFLQRIRLHKKDVVFKKVATLTYGMRNIHDWKLSDADFGFCILGSLNKLT